jgi:hypothetical protein
MAVLEHHIGILIVPQGFQPLHNNFINFIWDQGLAAFLAKPSWTKEPESGETGLGIRIAPGSC